MRSLIITITFRRRLFEDRHSGTRRSCVPCNPREFASKVKRPKFKDFDLVLEFEVLIADATDAEAVEHGVVDHLA